MVKMFGGTNVQAFGTEYAIAIERGVADEITFPGARSSCSVSTSYSTMDAVPTGSPAKHKPRQV